MIDTIIYFLAKQVGDHSELVRPITPFKSEDEAKQHAAENSIAYDSILHISAESFIMQAFPQMTPKQRAALLKRLSEKPN